MNLNDLLGGWGVSGFQLAYLSAVFLLGGLVKGVISFGLPLLSQLAGVLQPQAETR